MPAYLPHACAQMRAFVEEDGVPIGYTSRFREYWIELNSSGALQRLAFCPWCGAELPGSLRDDYFDALELLGEDFDIGTDLQDLPVEYRDDAWWRRIETPGS